VILLDASAVLALVYDEPGSDVVADALRRDDGAVSVVNLAEVLSQAERRGESATVRLAELRHAFAFVTVTEADALRSAQIYRTSPRRPALSLADRLALVTSLRLGVPILTADRAWAKVPGADVRLIR
jgi:ribonuclease VapC